MHGPPPDSGKTGVLFISSAEHPGADTFIHMLIMRGLERARFEVHAACSWGDSATPSAGYAAVAAIPRTRVQAVNFGRSMSGRSTLGKMQQTLGALASLRSLYKLARYVRAHRIAVVHSTDRPRDAFACAIVGKLSGAKTVIHAHLKCADWMGRSLRWSMGQVDALMGVSEFVVESLVQHGYRADRTYAVLNAIDLSAWDPQVDPAPVRASLGIPEGAPVVVCAARLFRGKGQDDVIRALPAICQEFPEVRVLIIGGDDLQAMRTSFTAELKALAAELGVTNNVIFTGLRRDMPQMMAACDVFALPSFEEPFGLVYLEAMAMKRPVVALRSGGAPEIVEHGRSGLLAEPGDIQGLAACIGTLLRDAPLRARMGEYGRQCVEGRFTGPRMAEDAARVYERLIASARK